MAIAQYLCETLMKSEYAVCGYSPLSAGLTVLSPLFGDSPLVTRASPLVTRDSPLVSCCRREGPGESK